MATTNELATGFLDNEASLEDRVYDYLYATEGADPTDEHVAEVVAEVRRMQREDA